MGIVQPWQEVERIIEIYFVHFIKVTMTSTVKNGSIIYFIQNNKS